MARALTRAEEILGALVSDDEWYATYGNAPPAVRQGDMGPPAPQGGVDGKSAKRIPKPSRVPLIRVGVSQELRDYLAAKHQRRKT
jgi:hypothetical protein